MTKRNQNITIWINVNCRSFLTEAVRRPGNERRREEPANGD